jgi:uncharacterized protein YyaL (SSP411 family)
MRPMTPPRTRESRYLELRLLAAGLLGATALGCERGGEAAAPPAAAAEAAAAVPASAAAGEAVPPTWSAAHAPAGIDWQEWSAAVFERAKAEQRFVLLDLGAVWCHWCHVMDRETYSRPDVQALLAKHYVAVRVDQDSRPDLAHRYERYGWPATIIFGPDGTEIVKRRGFIEGDFMPKLLQAVVDDPSPVPGIEVVMPASYAPAGPLSAAAREQLEARHREFQDLESGGLKGPYRLVNWEALEYALLLASEGDEQQQRWAELTLEASRALLDPVWGGGYQYSVMQSWTNPHFEKLMQFQAENLRTYALAYAALGAERDARSAGEIRRYVQEFLTSPEGSFYTSQDADLVPGEESAEYFALDDRARRARGIPRVDRNRYARENGWMIEAMATSYEFLGIGEDLAQALNAARWVIAQRALPGGGFRHGEATGTDGGPFLADTLAMGRAFLQLHRVTGEREWLARAKEAAAFIESHFKREAAGYASARGDGTPIEALPHFDSNLALARFANLLHHYTGDPAYRAQAEHALRFAATEEIYGRRREIGGVLLADRELGGEPLHLTVVGPKADAGAKRLHAAALSQPGWYKRVEWWDPAEGPLPRSEIQYPVLDRVAAFVCDATSCSRPLFEPDDIGEFLARGRPASTSKAAAAR